ncbi:hypothetical protein H1D32_03660 [Anaerobacillus sp. CMMVII]|uniref:hypothetical protein n=1 Tax=Anaerobacillus sp. CMMVII TaxID=2755588 RepID=UPI0021B80980|nr:hypothetical protein [Anaerobacillus sp. CMMVII]MCT8136927.1 hypothetical protein [Anaerobacillus sp. CMMVII]
MKKNLRVILLILVISIIGIWLLYKIPFESDINQTITAKVYKDGVVVQETSVIIKGARSNFLLADEQYYNGQFIIEYYERTGREGMKANITWNKEFEKQRVLYYQNATFPTLEINHKLLIDKEMKEFAIGMQDGTIIATSDEILHDYLEKLIH